MGGLDVGYGYQCIVQSEPLQLPQIRRSCRDTRDGVADGDHCKPTRRPFTVAMHSRPLIVC